MSPTHPTVTPSPGAAVTSKVTETYVSENKTQLISLAFDAVTSLSAFRMVWLTDLAILTIVTKRYNFFRGMDCGTAALNKSIGKQYGLIGTHDETNKSGHVRVVHTVFGQRRHFYYTTDA